MGVHFWDFSPDGALPVTLPGWSPLATRALPASTNVPGMAYRASERRSAARRNCLRRRDRARETGPFMVHASMKTCCSAGRVPATSSLTWHFISSETS